MNNQFNNPFEAIIAQMNQAKSNYDSTMSSLQSQLQSVRNAANQYVNPYGVPQMQQPAANIPAAPQQAQPQQQQAAPEPVPPHIQQLSALGEIRSAIDKTNELLEKLTSASGNVETKEETKTVKPLKNAQNEGDKK